MGSLRGGGRGLQGCSPIGMSPVTGKMVGVGTDSNKNLSKTFHNTWSAALHDPVSARCGMVAPGVCAAAVTVRKAQGHNPARKVANAQAAIAAAEVVFLTTIFQANEATPSAVTDALKGKERIDCTDPVGPNLSHGLIGVQSGSEVVQKLLPDTGVVEAFMIDGFANFENFDYPVTAPRPRPLPPNWSRNCAGTRWTSGPRTATAFGAHDAIAGARGTCARPLAEHGVGALAAQTPPAGQTDALARHLPRTGRQVCIRERTATGNHGQEPTGSL